MQSKALHISYRILELHQTILYVNHVQMYDDDDNFVFFFYPLATCHSATGLVQRTCVRGLALALLCIASTTFTAASNWMFALFITIGRTRMKNRRKKNRQYSFYRLPLIASICVCLRRLQIIHFACVRYAQCLHIYTQDLINCNSLQR